MLPAGIQTVLLYVFALSSVELKAFRLIRRAALKNLQVMLPGPLQPRCPPNPTLTRLPLPVSMHHVCSCTGQYVVTVRRRSLPTAS